RWAAAHGVSVAEGHRAGSRALRPVVESAIDLGVESLAVYAFSTENWTRPGDEVEALMEIFGETIDRELPDLAKQGVRTRFVGRRDRAPDWLQEKMSELERATAGETRLNLWIAFDYGGRAEIVEAARRIAEEGAVHGFVTMARPLRPLAPAAYAGTILGLAGAESGGLVWLVGGVLATFVFAFALNAVAETRPPATVAIGATILCSTWIGFGL